MMDDDLDMSDCVDLMSGDSVTRRRYGEQTIDPTQGLVIPGATTDLVFSAQVTPATGKDLQRLPEGQRTTRAIRVLTTTSLETATSDPSSTSSRRRADLVLYQGGQFEVQHVARWDAQGNFYDVIATEVRR